MSDDAEDLIANLLVHKPKNRFVPDLVVQHNWFHSTVKDQTELSFDVHEVMDE